jgi:hypothetical protein
VTPWERFADLVLQREAALCRVVSGVPPRDFAGMYVDDDDLDTILRSLPGLDGPGCLGGAGHGALPLRHSGVVEHLLDGRLA